MVKIWSCSGCGKELIGPDEPHTLLDCVRYQQATVHTLAKALRAAKTFIELQQIDHSYLLPPSALADIDAALALTKDK
jgi:hypothetical protein